jgi:hypothetical protein
MRKSLPLSRTCTFREQVNSIDAEELFGKAIHVRQTYWHQRKDIFLVGQTPVREWARSLSSESALALPKAERTSTSAGIGIRLMIAIRTVSHVHCDHHFYLLTNQQTGRATASGNLESSRLSACTIPGAR